MYLAGPVRFGKRAAFGLARPGEPERTNGYPERWVVLLMTVRGFSGDDRAG